MAQQRDNSQVTPRIRRARAATFGGFALVGALMYIWSTSVTAFRHHMGLFDAEGDLNFGIIAFGIGAGAAAGSLLIGRFIDIYGPKKVVGTTIVLYPLSIIPLGFVTGVWFALSFGIVLGLLRGATDTALNAHGVQVERFYRRPIMSAFHAFYSVGGFVFGMVGSYFAGRYPDSAATPFLVCGGGLLIASLVVSRFLLNKEDIAPEASVPNSTRQATTVATEPNGRIILLMIGFGVLLLGSMVGENSVADWGQEYLSREVGTTASVAGMAISFFTGAQFLGRFVGDRLAERIGAARLVFFSALTAVLGLILAIIGANAVTGIIAFSLFGLGVSCFAPLMLSSAGRKDPLNAGRNIGIVNGIGYTGMLAAPAALSLIVNAFGIGTLFYFPLILLSLLALFGPQLMRERPSVPRVVSARSAQ